MNLLLKLLKNLMELRKSFFLKSCYDLRRHHKRHRNHILICFRKIFLVFLPNSQRILNLGRGDGRWNLTLVDILPKWYFPWKLGWKDELHKVQKLHRVHRIGIWNQIVRTISLLLRNQRGSPSMQCNHECFILLLQWMLA